MSYLLQLLVQLHLASSAVAAVVAAAKIPAQLLLLCLIAALKQLHVTAVAIHAAKLIAVPAQQVWAHSLLPL